MLPSLQRVLRPALTLRSGNMLGRVRGSNIAQLRQPVPMQCCNLGTHPHKDPMEPLNSPQGAKDFIYSLHPTERTTLLRELHRFESIAIAQGEMVIAPPTSAQLRYVVLHNAIPFVGFGFLDNAIMIVAGTHIELSIGVILGISTMAEFILGGSTFGSHYSSAALGNLVSDLAGLGLAGYVEALACRCGLVGPDLNPKQADMWQTRVSTHTGKAIGVAIGCILGMFPLLFFKDEMKKKEGEREGKDGSLTSTSTDSSSSN